MPENRIRHIELDSETEVDLRAALDAYEFRDEDDWIGAPPDGAGFCIYDPLRFFAYLDRFGPAPGEGTPPDIPALPKGEKIDTRVSTYFARGRYTGRIKIGRSRMPEYRISQLQHSRGGEAADPLAIIEGDREWVYHNAFKRWHEGHEWFAPHPRTPRDR